MDPLLQLMITQPSIEVATNIEVSASFDPQVVRVGEKAIYRITFNALEDSIRWPESVTVPPGLELRQSARGQILWPIGNQLKPTTTINFHARAGTIGSYHIPEYEVEVYGRRVTVPEARLDVVPAMADDIARAQQLEIEVPESTIFAGQPVAVRVLLHGSRSNAIQTLTGVRFNGEGFLVEQRAGRQTITTEMREGEMVPICSYETTLTPLMTGPLTFSAQAFTAGNRFATTIIVQGRAIVSGGVPQYLLLDSDPTTIQVQPLPRAGMLPGFTGAIGKFTLDPPQLSTNRVRVGEMVRLAVTVRGPDQLLRLVPPEAPQPPDWQVFLADPEALPPTVRIPGMPPESGVRFVFSMTPLTNGITSTPAIPFSYFDPELGRYEDLTIPSVPIEVIPDDRPQRPRYASLETRAGTTSNEPALSALATRPGRRGSVDTVQRKAWFIALQVLPLAGLLALWSWDQRRRHFEKHPEILRRRKARRAFHRERRALERAHRTADAPAYSAAAVRAMRIACAPHFPADPEALVCRDVLLTLEHAGAADHATVRRFFEAADANEFAGGDRNGHDLLARRAELESVLRQLEAQL